MKLPLAVHDPADLAASFYGHHDFGQWNLRAQLLMSMHINYDKLATSGVFTTEELQNKSRFLAMVHSEMHFLYFQMTEALFNMVFALAMHDEKDLWLALAFCGDRQTLFYQDTYRLITLFRENRLTKPDMWRKIPIGTGREQRDIPLLRFIFYHGQKLSLTPEKWEMNLQNLDRLLHVFADDFSDRGEYNAYKHSLGHIHCRQVIQLGAEGGPLHTLGQSDDTTEYLERARQPRRDSVSGNDYWQTFRASKFIDFARDHLCCSVIHFMISNMMVCRRHRFVKSKPEGKVQLWLALDVSFDKLAVPNTGLKRCTFSA